MKKQDKNILLLTTLLCLSPIILGIIMYPQLPDQVAIHFNMYNEPDSYAPKLVFVFLFPIMMALLHLICIASRNHDKNKDANKKMHLVTQWIFPIISIVMYIVTIMIALEYPIDIRVVCMLIVGILLIVLGNYIPKTKNTYAHFGFHLGFNKNLDDQTYKKVARITGYVMILDGLLFIGSIFFKSIVSVFLVILIIIEGVILSVYTFKKSYKK